MPCRSRWTTVTLTVRDRLPKSRHPRGRRRRSRCGRRSSATQAGKSTCWGPKDPGQVTLDRSWRQRWRGAPLNCSRSRRRRNHSTTPFALRALGPAQGHHQSRTRRGGQPRTRVPGDRGRYGTRDERWKEVGPDPVPQKLPGTETRQHSQDSRAGRPGQRFPGTGRRRSDTGPLLTGRRGGCERWRCRAGPDQIAPGLGTRRGHPVRRAFTRAK